MATVRPSRNAGQSAGALAAAASACPAHRDGKRAVTMARKACELSGWSNANNIDTLAAAWAEAGNFDEAIRWQTKATEMRAADAEYVKGARERVAMYRERKPYRETRHAE